MRNLLIRLVVNTAALWVAMLVIPNFGVTAGKFGNQFTTLLVVGLIFGLVNAVIKPITKFFTLPFYVITLGLFAFIVNALMLKVVDWISGQIGLQFSSGQFFWTTVGAAVVITFVSMVLNLVLPEGKSADA